MILKDSLKNFISLINKLLSQFYPPLYLGMSIFLISLPFIKLDLLKDNIFIDFVKSLIPDIGQFIVFGLLYLVAIIIFSIIKFMFKFTKSIKIISCVNAFSSHVIENISQPVMGFYQGCSGLFFGIGLIGLVDNLPISNLIYMFIMSIAFALPTIIFEFNSKN